MSYIPIYILHTNLYCVLQASNCSELDPVRSFQLELDCFPKVKKNKCIKIICLLIPISYLAFFFYIIEYYTVRTFHTFHATILLPFITNYKHTVISTYSVPAPNQQKLHIILSVFTSGIIDPESLQSHPQSAGSTASCTHSSHENPSTMFNR